MEGQGWYSENQDPGDFGGAKKDGEKGNTGFNEKFKGRRLNPAKLEERSKKGLCFKCGNKWNMEHICKFKYMSLKLCEDGSGEEEGEELVTDQRMKRRWGRN